jgi:hypothetical protein
MLCFQLLMMLPVCGFVCDIDHRELRSYERGIGAERTRVQGFGGDGDG